MKILAINTAIKETSIALTDGKKIIHERSWGSFSNEAEKLMPEIAKAFKKAKIDFKEIKKIIVLKGPGTFTGLRVGVAAANTISYLLNVPIYSLTTFDYLYEKYKKYPIVLYAGRKEIYIKKSAKEELIICKAEDTEKFLKTAYGEILPEQKKFFKKIKLTKSKKTFGQVIANLNPKILKKEKIVEPLYIKKPY
jgi:tRNA threonylcarbamoyl adenosine modification protein YeaZ